MKYLLPAIFAGLPVLIITFLLVYWAIKKAYLSLDNDNVDLRQLKKADKEETSSVQVNRIYQKWLFFGGGFYGLMAFITYLHIEALEVYTFVKSYTDFANFIDQITVGAVIGLIIDSLINLIPSFTWFLYWPEQIEMNNGWYWLIAAYIGYQAGVKLAQWIGKRNIKITN